MPELDDAVERSQALRERLASNTVPTNPDDDVPLHLVGDSIGLGWMYPGGERLDVVVVDQRQLTDACVGELHRHEAAEPARSDYGGARSGQQSLAVGPEKGFLA